MRFHHSSSRKTPRETQHCGNGLRRTGPACSLLVPLITKPSVLRDRLEFCFRPTLGSRPRAAPARPCALGESIWSSALWSPHPVALGD